MTDWPLVAIRWALYADLGLLFGMPLFALYGPRGASPPIGRFCALLAVVGLVLSVLGFAVLAAAMGGTTLGQVDRATVSAMLLQSDMGWAWLVRMTALGLASGSALWPRLRDRVRAACLAGAGASAVATLAWFGHGAAGEGAGGLIHLVADIVHLLAASAWIGALPMLLALVWARGAVTPQRVDAARSALAGFATAGTVMVGAIIVSGLLNGLFLIAPAAIPSLGTAPYGRILIAKLLLFGLMLVCAALNRFRLTPRLTAASHGEGVPAALAALRCSIMIEAMLALWVLGSVGWLGTLEPPAMAG